MIGRNKTMLFFTYFSLTIAAGAVLLPLIWLFLCSVKSQNDLLMNTWGLPQKWEFLNYIKAWKGSKIPLYMLNSIRSTGVSVILTIVMVTPLSFVLSRFHFRGRRFLYYFFIAGMMIPIHSTIIPIYKIVGNYNLYNNLEVLGMVYGAFRISISFFILESFMAGIPRELEECAVIDGCSIPKMFFYLILPLSKDGIVTISILTVLSSWNELLVSMLLISDPLKKTLPIGLMGFITEFNSEYPQMAAGIMIALIPAVLFYAVAQEKIEKGMIAGSLKG